MPFRHWAWLAGGLVLARMLPGLKPSGWRLASGPASVDVTLFSLPFWQLVGMDRSNALRLVSPSVAGAGG